MKKEWILITLCIILFSCIASGRPSSSNDLNKIEFFQQSVEKHWIGGYSLSAVYGDLDEFSKIGIYYYFEIGEKTATITAEGYQTSFECECTLKEEKDRLLLLYKRTIESSTNVPIENVGDTLAIITCGKSGYYVQSPIIADTTWKYNTKLLLTKEKHN